MRFQVKYRGHKLHLAILGAVGFGALGGDFARADMVNLPASQDITIFGDKSDNNNNNNSSGGLFVGTDGSMAPKRGLIEFDIKDSGIPSDATITSVTLSLTLAQVAGSGGGTGTGGDSVSRDISLHAVTRAWNPTTNGTNISPPLVGFGQTGKGSTPHPGDTTWNYAMDSTAAWANPGGDFVSSASADTMVSESVNSAYTWSGSGMVADVQSWLDGTTANDGWLLQNADEFTAATDFRAFYTKEAVLDTVTVANGPLVSSSFAPNLNITFVVVPEPASAGLLLVAAPLMLRRRSALGRSALA